VLHPATAREKTVGGVYPRQRTHSGWTVVRQYHTVASVVVTAAPSDTAESRSNPETVPGLAIAAAATGFASTTPGRETVHGDQQVGQLSGSQHTDRHSLLAPLSTHRSGGPDTERGHHAVPYPCTHAHRPIPLGFDRIVTVGKTVGHLLRFLAKRPSLHDSLPTRVVGSRLDTAICPPECDRPGVR
jgi:hypothetical protein